VDENIEDLLLIGSPNEDIIDTWYDSINMLINAKPEPNITCFVECLVDTQLLDLQTLGYEIPHDIPKIPDFPDNFDFKLTKKI
jgi:hypothetical protein